MNRVGTRSAGRRTVHRASAVALLTLLLGAVGLILPATAQAIPGVPDCKESPVPEVPGRGVVGFFEPAPRALPPDGDPFAAGSGTSIHQQYGYGGLRWNTYDLGCGPDVVRAPDATSGTALANIVMTVPKAAVAATGAVVGAALNPTFLTVFDPLIGTVVDTLRRTLFEHWMPLVLAAVGLLLVWKARSAAIASSAGAIGWALLVLVLATVVFRWPLVAGQAADRTVTTTLAAVSGGLNETGTTDDPSGGLTAGEQVTTSMHHALLYQTWLGGTFGDANAAVAKRYGPAIFDSQALTWREAATMRADPAAGRRIVEAKQEKFEQTSAKVKAEDPDAYEYLTGKRPDTRIGYALLALVATLCAIPFLLMAGLLVLGALLIVRFGIMLFPAFATLGLFPTMRALVIGIGETMAGAVVNAIVFGVGVALTVKGIGFVLAPGTALPGWLRVVLVLLLSVVMWVALHPFRRMVHMVTRDGTRSIGGFGLLGRGAARAGGRLSSAFGGFAGAIVGSTLSRRQEARGSPDPDAVPARVESSTILSGAGAPTVAGAMGAPGAATRRAEAADEPEPPQRGAPSGGTGGPAPAGAGSRTGGSSGATGMVLAGTAAAAPGPRSSGGNGTDRNGPDRTSPDRTGAGRNGSGRVVAPSAAQATAARGGAHDGPAVRSALFGPGEGGRFEAGGAPAAPSSSSKARRGQDELDHLDDDEVVQLYRPGGAGVSGVRR